MKKILFAFLIMSICIGFAFSQSIVVTSPHSGDTVYKGNNWNITWSKSGSMDANVKIRLYQGSTKVLGITDSTPNNGSFQWPVPAKLSTGTYFIRVKTVNNAVSDDGDSFLLTDAPTQTGSITVTSPSGSESLCKGKTFEITWTKSGSLSGNVKIRLYQGSTKILNITNSTPNSGSYQWVIPSNLANGSYYIRVKTVDNSVFDDSNTFSVKSCVTMNWTVKKIGVINQSVLHPLALPDFMVYGEQLGFVNWEDKTVKFHAAVKNRGQKDAENIPIELKIYRRGVTEPIQIFKDTIHSLPRNMTVAWDKNYKLTEIGTYDFMFKVNPSAVIKEYLYSNNSGVRKTICREKLPDLIVWLMTVKVDIISRSKVWVGVKNIGQKVSAPTKLKFSIERKGTKYLDIPSIAPGKFYTAERRPWFHTLKDVWVTMYIDPYHTLREDKELNNSARTKLIVWSHTIFDK